MKRRLLFIFFLIFFVSSCSEEESPEESVNDPEKTYYYLSFKVTCFEDNSFEPVWCNISVFDVDTKQRLIRGSTFIQDGWFTSTVAFDIDDKIRIELWDFDDRCIMWGTDITVSSSSQIFVDSKDKFRTNNTSNNSGHFHLGTCKARYDEATGAWGP